MPSPVARALRHVPTVYFYVPAVRRGMGADTGLVMTEDVCAVLWLTELAADKSKGARQASVRRAAGLSEGRMSTVLATLVPAFIESAYDADSRRNHRLMLTTRGSALLATIKRERQEFLRELFKHLTPQQQAACANALSTLEKTMWCSVAK